MAEDMPLGLHPKVVGEMYGVHFRTVFRWISKGFLLASQGRVHPGSVDSTLQAWKGSISKCEARKTLGVRANTLKNWKNNGLIKSVTVMGEERIVTDSLQNAPRKKKRGSALKRRNHRSVGYMADLLHSAPSQIKKYLGSDIKAEMVDGLQMVPLQEVERLTILVNGSCNIIEAATYLGKTRAYVEKMISVGALESFKFLGKRRVPRSSLLIHIKRTDNILWLRDKQVPALKNDR